jgi:hypothetical protein
VVVLKRVIDPMDTVLGMRKWYERMEIVGQRMRCQRLALTRDRTAGQLIDVVSKVLTVGGEKRKMGRKESRRRKG